jgi:hypothetical protein
MEDKILKQIESEAEKVYPIPDEEESYYTPLKRDNALKREGYIQGYISNAKKRESDAVEFAEYCMKNIFDIDFSKTTEEIYELFKQQKQE